MSYIIFAVVAVIIYVKRDLVWEWVMAMWQDDKPEK